MHASPNLAVEKIKKTGIVRIGFVSDLDGPYAHVDGRPGLEAIKMAVEDYQRNGGDREVEVMAGDHLNDAGTASELAASWFDEFGLDVMVGGVNSNSSLAMAQVAAARRKPYMAVGSGSMAHTTTERTDYTIHYAYDTNSLGAVLGPPVVARGGDSWYFLSADYPIGGQLMSAVSDSVKSAGGTVLSFVQPPRSSEDFTPFLERALQSGAKVLGLTNTHGDLIRTVGAARSLGLPNTMTIAAPFVFLPELHKIGIDVAQGMYVSDSWYWDRDMDSRAWSQRFLERTGMMPSSIQAANYSATSNYLKIVQNVGNTEGDNILAALRSATFDDMYMKGGWVRDDGRVIHDMYVYRVKSPAQSRGDWDYYELIDVAKGDTAWRPQQS